MTSISDLTNDLVEEILSRVPMTSLRALRSTCKLWNALSKDPSFKNKHCGQAANENLVIMWFDHKVCIMSVNLHGNHNHKDSVEPLIKQLVKLNLVQIYEVFQCNGLLLCITYDNSRLMVWNPYSGQIRSIQQPRNDDVPSDHIYAMGYDNNNNSYKILRTFFRLGQFGYEIYDLKSYSWRVLDVTIKLCIHHNLHGMSLKGNIYFIGTDVETLKDSLLCFDFTRETFEQLLPLPFNFCFKDSVMISSVREEKAAVLFRKCDAFEIKIWITNKIDQLNAVSWSNFFKLDLIPSENIRDFYGCFFVDEKKKLVLFWDKYGTTQTNHKAYIVGEGGYYREVDLGHSNRQPLMCSSYVPSPVQI